MRCCTSNATAWVQVTSTDSDLSCVGCPTTDTRVQITATTTYPYSAAGMLLGALTAEDECAPFLRTRPCKEVVGNACIGLSAA